MVECKIQFIRIYLVGRIVCALVASHASALLPLDEGGYRKSKPRREWCDAPCVRVKLHRVSGGSVKGAEIVAPSGVQ